MSTWDLRNKQWEMAVGIVRDIQQVLDRLLGALRNRFPIFRMVQLLLSPKLTHVPHDQQENLLAHPLLCRPLPGDPQGGLNTCTLDVLPRAQADETRSLPCRSVDKDRWPEPIPRRAGLPGRDTQAPTPGSLTWAQDVPKQVRTRGPHGALRVRSGFLKQLRSMTDAPIAAAAAARATGYVTQAVPGPEMRPLTGP